MKKKKLLEKLNYSKLMGVFIAVPIDDGKEFAYLEVNAKELSKQIEDLPKSNNNTEFWVSDMTGDGVYLWFETRKKYINK